MSDRVRDLLRVYPDLRDNDNKLIANIWHDDMIKKYELDVFNKSAADLLIMFASGKLPSTETIRRTRQKLQQELPELRGEDYLKRQSLQGKVKQEILNFREIVK